LNLIKLNFNLIKLTEHQFLNVNLNIVSVEATITICGRRSRCSCTSRRTYRLSTASRRSFPVATSIFWNTLLHRLSLPSGDS